MYGGQSVFSVPFHLNVGDTQENGSTLGKISTENKPSEQTPLEINDTSRMPVGIAGDQNGGKGSQQYKGFQLVHQQIKALLIKRFHHASRSHKDFLAQVQTCFCCSWLFPTTLSTMFFPAMSLCKATEVLQIGNSVPNSSSYDSNSSASYSFFLSFCLESITYTKFMIQKLLAQHFIFNIIRFCDNQNLNWKHWKSNRWCSGAKPDMICVSLPSLLCLYILWGVYSVALQHISNNILSWFYVPCRLFSLLVLCCYL